MKAIWKSVPKETVKYLYFTQEQTLSVNESNKITENDELTANS
jgi:hypothetical protein